MAGMGATIHANRSGMNVPDYPLVMKIAILGAGAMGSVIGSALAEAESEVILLDVWVEAVETINRRGLIIRDQAGSSRTVPIRATTEPTKIGTADLVIVFVKCYHTEEAVRGALSMIGSKTTVLSLQNGWGNGPRIAKIIGEEKLLIGVSYHSATMLGPGEVLHAGRGMTFMGELNGEISKRLLEIAAAFQQAGLEVTPSSTVLREIWAKLALNVATLPTSAAIRVTADELLRTPEMENLMQELLRETLEVAHAFNIDLSFEERWSVISGLLKKLAPKTKGSMLQDVERGRRTEIDVINGAIVDTGRAKGILTPFNSAMVALIKALEASFGSHEAA
jgi:2-dehydropantoate 2-reductase